MANDLIFFKLFDQQAKYIYDEKNFWKDINITS